MRKTLLVGAVVVIALAVFGIRAHRAHANEHFFRLKIGLTYKSAPVDIDIVVGCGVHYAWSQAAGGSTSEIMSMTAYWFATSMPDGHAIAIRTVPGPNAGACWGDTTANGEVGKHWLPLIVWYEQAGDYAHGVAYVSQLAYENPNAKFGFRSAAVERANRADYDRFVTTGRKNLWPPYFTDAMIGGHKRPHIADADVRMDELVKDPRQAWRYSYSIECIGVRRVRLDPDQRAKVRAAWPSNHPKYWGYKTWQEHADAWHKLLTEDQREEVAGSFYPAGSSRDGDHLLELYPMLADYSLAELNPQTPGNDRYVLHVLIDPALRGFEYCDFPAPPRLVEAVTHKPASLQEGFITCRIGSYTPPTAGSCRQWTFWVAFENDEYAIIPETPL